MQTFLPYADFRKTAEVLDRQRLGKQRVETLQVLRTIIIGNKKGWNNHPAVNMWRGYEGMLVEYGVAICDEWINRGYKDTCRDKILEFDPGDRVVPFWLGDPDLHRSHQSNLNRKDPDFYTFDVPDDLPYVWPV